MYTVTYIHCFNRIVQFLVRINLLLHSLRQRCLSPAMCSRVSRSVGLDVSILVHYLANFPILLGLLRVKFLYFLVTALPFVDSTNVSKIFALK